jgi:ADP-ribose pyrophosphatase YjhB (NUDIX family)
MQSGNNTPNQATSYPNWIMLNRDVKPDPPRQHSRFWTSGDIRYRTPTIKDPFLKTRFTLQELKWYNSLDNYTPIAISDGTTANENNDLFLDQQHLANVILGITKFIGYADPPLVDGKLPDKLRNELETGIATRYRLVNGKLTKELKEVLTKELTKEELTKVLTEVLTQVIVNRKSHTGPLSFDPDTNLPLNPLGRTGLTGRGFLGRWGPNHATDCLLVRFKDNKLQVVLAYRSRDNEWAIPGGMVDFDESPINTMFREVKEETGLDFCSQIKNYFFSEDQPDCCDTIFPNSPDFISWTGAKCQVDDDRNTDNSWMETMAFVIILSDRIADSFTMFDVQDTQEIGTACWVDVSTSLLSGKTPYSVSAKGERYKGPLWGSHVKLLNDLVQQIVHRGFAVCNPDGSYSYVKA